MGDGSSDVAARLIDLSEVKIAIVTARPNRALEPCQGTVHLTTIPHHDSDVVRCPPIATPVRAAVQLQRLLVVHPDADALVIEQAYVEQRADIPGPRRGKNSLNARRSSSASRAAEARKKRSSVAFLKGVVLPIFGRRRIVVEVLGIDFIVHFQQQDYLRGCRLALMYGVSPLSRRMSCVAVRAYLQRDLSSHSTPGPPHDPQPAPPPQPPFQHRNPASPFRNQRRRLTS